MAKPVLGRGLGELLKHDSGTSSTRATLTASTPTTPPLSEGMSTLVRGQPPTSEASAELRARERRTLRLTLFGTDALLTVGALVFYIHQPVVQAVALALCGLAVLLGAWLGWCGLRLN